jgi:hypothetical protein
VSQCAERLNVRIMLRLCAYTNLCTAGKSAKQGAGSGSQEGGSTAVKSEATKKQKQTPGTVKAATSAAAGTAAGAAALAAAAAAMQQSSSSTDAALQTRLGRLQLATQLVRAVLESDVDSPKKVDTMSKIVSQSLADADLLTAAADGTSTAAAAASASAAATVEEAAAAGAAAVGSSTTGFSELQQQVHKLRLRISQMHHVLSSGDSCDAKLLWLSASVQL